MEVDTGVAALDPVTGQVLWARGLWPSGGASARNIVAQGGRVYLAEAGPIVALDAATGALRWAVNRPPESSTSYAYSAVDDRALYVGARDHRVVAYGVEDGRELWQTDVAAPDWLGYSARVTGIALAGDTLYAAVDRWLTPNGYDKAAVVVALDRATGRELWRYQSAGTKSNAIAAPVVAGRLLVVSDYYGGSFFAVDRFTGKEVWRVLNGQGSVGPGGSPVVVGDTVYVGGGDTYVYAADAATGRVRWKARTGGSINRVAVCGAQVLAQNQQVVVVDRASGRVRHTLFAGDNDEVITSGFGVAGGRAFLVGNRFAYGVQCE